VDAWCGRVLIEQGRRHSRRLQRLWVPMAATQRQPQPAACCCYRCHQRSVWQAPTARPAPLVAASNSNSQQHTSAAHLQLDGHLDQGVAPRNLEHLLSHLVGRGLRVGVEAGLVGLGLGVGVG